MWVDTELFDLLIKINNPESIKKAVCIASKSAESGNKQLQARLARLYVEGKGVQCNLNTAAELMRKAAKQNLGWAKNELFDILWKINSTESLSEMISVATDFAKSGDGGAMGRLGRAYRDGKGVPKDLNKAAEWMRCAKEKGIAWANWELIGILWKTDTLTALEEIKCILDNEIKKKI